MGLGGVLFLWSLLGGAAALLAVIASFVFWRAFRAKRPVLAGLSGVVALMSGLAALGAAAFIAAWSLGAKPHASDSPQAFEGEFGFPAPQDVREIRSVSSGSTDSQSKLLTFRASPATVAAITSNRFVRTPARECVSVFASAASANSGPQESADCYVAHPFDQTFATNTAWLSYEPTTQRVHYLYRGVD